LVDGFELMFEAGEGFVEDFEEAVGAGFEVLDVVDVAEELALLVFEGVFDGGFDVEVGLEFSEFADGVEVADHFEGGRVVADFRAVAVDFGEEAVHFGFVGLGFDHLFEQRDGLFAGLFHVLGRLAACFEGGDGFLEVCSSVAGPALPRGIVKWISQ